MRSSWNGRGRSPDRALLRGRSELLGKQLKGRNSLGNRQRLEAGGIRTGRGRLLLEVLGCRLVTGRFGTSSVQRYGSGCWVFELQFVVTEDTVCTVHHPVLSIGLFLC